MVGTLLRLSASTMHFNYQPLDDLLESDDEEGFRELNAKGIQNLIEEKYIPKEIEHLQNLLVEFQSYCLPLVRMVKDTENKAQVDTKTILFILLQIIIYELEFEISFDGLTHAMLEQGLPPGLKSFNEKIKVLNAAFRWYFHRDTRPDILINFLRQKADFMYESAITQIELAEIYLDTKHRRLEFAEKSKEIAKAFQYLIDQLGSDEG